LAAANATIRSACDVHIAEDQVGRRHHPRGPLGDYTCFASVSELGAAPAFTVRSYEDALPRRVALGEIDLASGSVRSYGLVPGSPVPVSF
jgi:hypothetical protein